MTGEIFMGKKLWWISPGHLANFPWPYVTLIFTCELFERYFSKRSPLTYTWKEKLTIKYTVHVDLTVENLLHIKKFSKNCLKSAILYNIKLYIKIYYHNVTQRSLGDYCKQSRHRGISIVTSYQVIIKLPYVTWFWYSTSYRMLYNDLKLILMAEILNWKAIHNLLCSISSNNTQVLRTWGGGFQEKGNWNLKGIISSNKIEFNKVNRKSFTVS